MREPQARPEHGTLTRCVPPRGGTRCVRNPANSTWPCEAAILAVVTRSSTTRKAIETQRDLFLGRGMHDPGDAPHGSLRTGGLKLIVRPPGHPRRGSSSTVCESCPHDEFYRS